jgi:hypothetical protein
MLPANHHQTGTARRPRRHVPTSEREAIERVVIWNVRGEFSIHGDSFFTDTCYRESIGFR